MTNENNVVYFIKNTERAVLVSDKPFTPSKSYKSSNATVGLLTGVWTGRNSSSKQGKLGIIKADPYNGDAGDALEGFVFSNDTVGEGGTLYWVDEA